MSLGFGFSLPASGIAYGKNQAAALSLDFTSANQTLDSRITFSRATTGYRYNQSGVLESMAINAPRFDYNPATLEPRGLLLEEQRTNICLQSEDLSVSTAWQDPATASFAISTNQIAAPNNAVTADLFLNTTTAVNRHTMNQGVNVANRGATYAWSFYVKAYASTTTPVYLTAYLCNSFQGADRVGININPVNGVINGAAAVAGLASFVSSSSQSVGNGWYRITLVGSIGGTGAATIRMAFGVALTNAEKNLVNTYTGDGTSGLYIWGVQLEQATFVTSYIPTTTAAVIRQPDIASMTGTNFSSWFNSSAGTFFMDAEMYETQETFFRYMLTSNTGTGVVSDLIAFLVPGNTSNVRFGVTDATVQSCVLQSAVTLNTRFKVAGAYQNNSFGLSINGSAALTDSSGTIPVGLDRLYLGGNADTGVGTQSSMRIQQIKYFNRRLADTEIQAITS